MSSPVCSVQSGSTLWDLSSLANSKEDYTWTSASGEKIVLNVCRSVVTELFGIDAEADTIGAFVQGEKGDRSIGSTTSNLTLTNSNPPTPLLILPNGAACAGTSLLSSTLIHFTCSTSEETGPVLLGTLPPGEEVGKACAYVFEWKTKAACPKTGGMGHLGDWGAVGVLVGLSILLLFSYLLGSFLYNRFILNLRGTAQLPRFSCPTPSLPSISNPFSRSGSSSRPFSSWRRSSGYGRVPAEPLAEGDSDEEEGLVGRFGLDDSDEDEDARALEGDSRVWRSQPPANGGGAAPKGGNGLISL